MASSLGRFHRTEGRVASIHSIADKRSSGKLKGDEGVRRCIVTHVTLGALVHERSRLLLGKVQVTK